MRNKTYDNLNIQFRFTRYQSLAIINDDYFKSVKRYSLLYVERTTFIGARPKHAFTFDQANVLLASISLDVWGRLHRYLLRNSTARLHYVQVSQATLDV